MLHSSSGSFLQIFLGFHCFAFDYSLDFWLSARVLSILIYIYTFIQPALSIGNVGQLAVDLLISSTRAERIGYFDEPNVLPCVGNDAYWPTPQGDLALPLEGHSSTFTYIYIYTSCTHIFTSIMALTMMLT